METQSLLAMQSNIRTLSEAKDLVTMGLDSGNIPYLSGPSGVGKSALIGQIAEERGAALIVLSLGQMDALDLAGIPSLTNGRTVMNDPAIIPLAKDAEAIKQKHPNLKEFIVFIDEMPEGDVATQKATYRLLNERMINNSPIHPNVKMVAAGNRAIDGAHTEKLLPTVANRMFHITIKVDHKGWIKWATGKGISPVIRAFIATTPDKLHRYDEASDEDAWASPRTYERLNTFLGTKPLTERSPVVQGAPIMFLGAECGQALLNFASATDLPPIADVLADPTGFAIDSLSPGSLFLLGQSLISIADSTNITQILKVMERMPKDHLAINYMGLSGLPPATMSSLMASPDFVAFAQNHLNMLQIIAKVK